MIIRYQMKYDVVYCNEYLPILFDSQRLQDENTQMVRQQIDKSKKYMHIVNSVRIVYEISLKFIFHCRNIHTKTLLKQGSWC